MVIELVATTLDDALAIESAGADRILLASSLVEGGLTPSIGLIVAVVSEVGIPVNIMLRPHSAGYCYSPKDMDVIEGDLCAIAETKANAVVLGILDENGSPDLNALERLLPKARDKAVVIGRAIDEAPDIIEAAKAVSKYDEIKAILTCGGRGTLPERMTNIRKMREAVPELEIIAAGDIGVNNLADFALLAKTGSFQAETAVRIKRSTVLGVDFAAATELVRFARAL